MRQAIAKFAHAPLECPVCHEALALDGAFLRCENHHSFSINRHGYVDLRRNARNSSHYTADFFSNRALRTRLGLYHDMEQAITQALNTCIRGIQQGSGESPEQITILDVGCGDGTVTKTVTAGLAEPSAESVTSSANALEGSSASESDNNSDTHISAREANSAQQQVTVIGCDISADAIKEAARGGGPSLWVVGDGAHLPVRANTVNVILNVFAPAQYEDFSRVAPGGWLIKVIPAPEHMKQLRTALGLAPAGTSDALELLKNDPRMELISSLRVTQTSPLTSPEERESVALMSPVSFGRLAAEPQQWQSQTRELIDQMPEITTDCWVTVSKIAHAVASKSEE